MSAPHITVGVDGSDGGRRALAWALHYAAETGAELDVVTVFYYQQSADPHHVPSQRAVRRRRDAERLQQREVEAALIGQAGAPPINRLVLPGASTAAVLQRAARDSDLLVLGSHGHNPIESRLLGTVSADCIRGAECPVVVIPAHWAESATGSSRQMRANSTAGPAAATEMEALTPQVISASEASARR